MIIGTIYLLPLVRIGVKTDLLKAIAEGIVRKPIKFQEIKINSISIFELQAKATKLNIPIKDIVRAIDTILKTFQIIPFYKEEIIREAYKLRRILANYIDSIIVATAIALKDNLVTEDSTILSHKIELEKNYGIKILSYQDYSLGKGF